MPGPVTTSTRRLLAIALALLAMASPAIAITAPTDVEPPSRVAAQVTPQAPTALVVGDDACSLLTDEEILRATDGSAVLSRTPGAVDFLPAGCQWEIEGAEGAATSSLYLGIAIEGGRSHYDTMVPFEDAGQRIAGVGEEAVDLGFGSVLAVEGDTAVSLQYAAFGFGLRPSKLVARALGWVALTRIASRPALLSAPALAGPGVLATDQPSLDAVAAIRTNAFSEDAVTATTDLLASAGIEVVDPRTGEPLQEVRGTPSALRLMDFQARSMALEAWSGNGLAGTSLDAMQPVPEDMPLTSSVLAAWLAAVDTPNARLGRALMAGQDVSDPTRLEFPTLALALFSADMLIDAGASTTGTARSDHEATAFLAAELPADPMIGRRTAQADPCTMAQTFVDNVIHTVFEVLRIPTPGNVAGAIVVSMWNWLVSQGEALVRSAVAALTAPVIAFIRSVAGIIAVIGQVVSAAQPYSLSVSSTIRDLVLSVDPAAPIQGAFEAIVVTALPDWDPTLKGCAQVADVTLPPLTAKGRPISWGLLSFEGPLLRQPLIVTGMAETTLDQGEVPRARYPFTSTTEPPDLAEGFEHTVFVTVEARVEREDVRQGLQQIVGTLYSGIPAIIRPQVQRVLGPEVDSIIGRVIGTLAVKSSGRMSITYHTPRETPTPEPNGSPGPMPTAPPGQAVWVHVEREAVEEVVDSLRIVELYSCDGPYGPWHGVVRTGAINYPGGADRLVRIHEFPISFSFPGRSGQQVTEISGTASVDLEWAPGYTQTVDFDYGIGIAVNGTTMFYSGLGGTWSLPIEPAPAGTCPGESQPAPEPEPPEPEPEPDEPEPGPQEQRPVEPGSSPATMDASAS